MIPKSVKMNAGLHLIVFAFTLACRPALCQQGTDELQQRPSPRVYVCPGLNKDTFRTYQTDFPGSLCPCHGTDGAKVALDDPYMLLSLPGFQVDYPNQCLWYRAFNNTWPNKSIPLGGNMPWLKELCDIQELPQNMCFREVANARRVQEERWTAWFNYNASLSHPRPQDLTRLGNVSFTVVDPCSPTNCSRDAGEVCDERLHYCRHVCDGPTGGTRNCTSAIADGRATCEAESLVTGPLDFKCVCKTRFVAEYDAQDRLVNCKDPCWQDTDCKWNEVCSAPPRRNAISANAGSGNSSKTCMDVCSSNLKTSQPNCPGNSTCEALGHSKPHASKCVCNSQHRPYYPKEGQMLCPKICKSGGQKNNQHSSCADNERCVLPRITFAPADMVYSNVEACIPTCETMSCGSNAECNQEPRHQFKCKCNEGFFTEDGNIAGSINDITTCHEPIPPSPLHPTIHMKLGNLPDTQLCLVGVSQQGTTCANPYAAEGRNLKFTCYLKGVFPKPSKVTWELIGPNGFTVESLGFGNVELASTDSGQHMRGSTGLDQQMPSRRAHVQGSIDHLTRDYVTSKVFMMKKEYDGRQIRCEFVLEHPSGVAPGNGNKSPHLLAWHADTTAVKVYACSSPDNCGSIATLSAYKRVASGGPLDLTCKTDFPLLQHGSQADCSWTLTRQGQSNPPIKIDFSSWQKGSSFAVDGIDQKEADLDRINKERQQGDPRTDCSLIIKKTTLAFEGNWSCSAVLFDGSNTTVKDPNKEKQLPVVVVVLPKTVFVTLEPNEYVTETPYNNTSISDGENRQQGSTGYEWLPSHRKVRLNLAKPTVTLIFKCFAHDTHPAPTKFIWKIGHSKQQDAIGKEEFSVMTASEQAKNENKGVGNATMGPLPQLKTYSSTYTTTFHAKNEKGDWLLDEQEKVTCDVSYGETDKDNSRDGQNLPVLTYSSSSPSGQPASLIIVFREKAGPGIVVITAAVLAVLSLVLVIAGALYAFRRQLRNKWESIQSTEDSRNHAGSQNRAQAEENVNNFNQPNIPAAVTYQHRPSPSSPTSRHEQPQHLMPSTSQALAAQKTQHGSSAVTPRPPKLANKAEMAPMISKRPISPVLRTPGVEVEPSSVLVLDNYYGNPGRANLAAAGATKQGPAGRNLPDITHQDLVYVELDLVQQQKAKGPQNSHSQASRNLPETQEELIYADLDLVRKDRSNLEAAGAKGVTGKKKKKKNNVMKVEEDTIYATIIGALEDEDKVKRGEEDTIYAEVIGSMEHNG